MCWWKRRSTAKGPSRWRKRVRYSSPRAGGRRRCSSCGPRRPAAPVSTSGSCCERACPTRRSSRWLRTRRRIWSSSGFMGVAAWPIAWCAWRRARCSSFASRHERGIRETSGMKAGSNLRPVGSSLGTVSDWMSHEPSAVVEDCPIRWALAQMEQGGFRHLLVLDGERLSGIVSSRDVRRLAVGDLHAPLLAEPVRKIMTEDPVTIGAGEPVTDAARLLLELKIGALPVRGPDGIIGIFTTADALEALIAVNPHAALVQGVEAVPSLLAVEGPVDLAVITIPAAAVLPALKECVSKGVGGAVVISAGFRESNAEGREREAELRRWLSEQPIRVLGPNCLGWIRPSRRLNLTFAPGMPEAGGIAFISHSGALAVAILDWARERRVRS